MSFPSLEHLSLRAVHSYPEVLKKGLKEGETPEKVKTLLQSGTFTFTKNPERGNSFYMLIDEWNGAAIEVLPDGDVQAMIKLGKFFIPTYTIPRNNAIEAARFIFKEMESRDPRTVGMFHHLISAGPLSKRT